MNSKYTDNDPTSEAASRRFKDARSDYIDRIRKEWSDLEEATQDIWDEPTDNVN